MEGKKRGRDGGKEERKRKEGKGSEKRELKVKELEKKIVIEENKEGK